MYVPKVPAHMHGCARIQYVVRERVHRDFVVRTFVVRSVCQGRGITVIELADISKGWPAASRLDLPLAFTE